MRFVIRGRGEAGRGVGGEGGPAAGRSPAMATQFGRSKVLAVVSFAPDLGLGSHVKVWVCVCICVPVSQVR